MLNRLPKTLKTGFTLFVLLSAHLLAHQSIAFAQDEGLSFEQAQTRTTYARKEMQKAQRKLDEAESREGVALRELEELRKGMDDALKKVDQATEARQVAEKQYQHTRENWSRESERLKRLHQQRK